ncbi:MAG: UDP-N-acetylmuramoyl-tripeptide--D-alanyl-D-alanine ligase, partial [Gammaproteobacteria bacterium]
MIGMRLEQATQAVGGSLLGQDAAFQGVSTDTREDLAGSLFVALRGERFDAHDYAGQAANGQAAALLVERDTGVDKPQILVPDTLASLGLLAQAWRGGFTRPLVAITGSNGKTTVKQMVASILSQRGRVHATHGNLNNHIGVPKTLFELGDGHDYAVVEMGANHAGEIEYLVSLAQPDAALITNAGPAHLEGFGDLDGVANAKGEIFAGLPDTSTAVINFDDPYAPLWRELAGDRVVIGFGLEAQNGDFRGE